MPSLSQKPQERVLDGLTAGQCRAVVAPDGAVLVIAGAGSGKTRVLTHRLAYLLAGGVPAGSIAALTFTNKAANEMKERVERLAGSRHKRQFVGTFHGFAAGILRQDGRAVGLSRRFTILDEDEALDVMKHAYRRANISPKDLAPEAARAFVSRIKNEYRGPADIPEFVSRRETQEILRASWDAYENLLTESDAVDFDNLLIQTLRLFDENPKILQKYRDRIRYVLVDEYQDTNRPQYLLLKKLVDKTGNLFVVGDDWQSIYSFRGSDFRNILRFQHDWPDAKVFFLEENFRSTGTVVEAANRLIAKNRYRTEKHLYTENPAGPPIAITRLGNEREEASYILALVEGKSAAGLPLSEMAVFFRTHAQSRLIEEECIARGVPYRLVGGLTFYQRKEIRDVIAYMRFVSNARDLIALKRIINIPPRGIGRKTVERLETGNWKLGLNDATSGFNEFCALISEARKCAASRPLSETLKLILEKTNYREFLLKDPEEGEARWENVRELLSVSRAFDRERPARGLERFLETVSLLQDAAAKDKDSADRLNLMTIHAAKGLEFSVVFMTGCEEGIFPHANAVFREHELEEERRLAYVALTRAKLEAHFTHARRRVRFGAFEQNSPSRFLDDIPEHLSVRVDQTMFDRDEQNKIVLD